MDLLLEEPIPASATTSQWTVENFQVPVPIGDCSIHVLIHYNGEEYVVEYAFIMDGGAEAGRLSPSDAINRTLEFVNRYLITEYHLPNDSRLRFNLWVVTHWDADHFYGVRALLLDDDQDWKGDNFVENPLLYCGKYVETVAKEFIFNVYGERLSLRNPDEESRPRFCVMGANGYGVDFNPRSAILAF
ncbi:hypothetical protein NW762_014837 [Fusarium torreyae]|uniref:Uncharacterized protein n=1 Tax=Fusarium torreyae TaxID=1237075 RepID=A0A9W8RI01_9HYPO|nr:hypothetical protein NW762_014837 [Fusarium torreyae]